MKKEEADILRDIADVLDEHCNYLSKDSTNKEDHWFHWGAQAIRAVIFSSGFKAFNDEKYDTTTTHQFSKEDE